MAASAEEREEPRRPREARRRAVPGSGAARARSPASSAPWTTWRLEPVTSFRSVRRWTSEWRTSPWQPVSPDPASLHVPQLRHDVSTEPVRQPCGPEPCREPAPDSGQVGRSRTEMLQDPSDHLRCHLHQVGGLIRTVLEQRSRSTQLVQVQSDQPGGAQVT